MFESNSVHFKEASMLKKISFSAMIRTCHHESKVCYSENLIKPNKSIETSIMWLNPQQNVRIGQQQTGGLVAITITQNISLKIFMLTSFQISNRKKKKNHRPDLANIKLNYKLRGNIYTLSNQSKDRAKL